MNIWVGNFNTLDGAGMRDLINVADLVQGHSNALQLHSQTAKFRVIYLGIGISYKVLDVLSSFEETRA